MPLNLSEIVSDPDLVDSWTLIRSSGEFVAGGWQDNPTSIPRRGVTSPASDQELQMIPAGDRAIGSLMFFDTLPMYTTRTGQYQGLSDKIQYQGSTYRLMNVGPWQAYGYYSALGVRMEGD